MYVLQRIFLLHNYFGNSSLTIKITFMDMYNKIVHPCTTFLMNEKGGEGGRRERQ